MRLTTIVEVRERGVIGLSTLSSEIGPDYSPQQLAARVMQQLDAAKRNLADRLAARRALALLQRELDF